MVQKSAKIRASFLLVCILTIQFLDLSPFISPSQAQAEFSEDFSDTSQMSSWQGLNVDTASGIISLPQFKTSLDVEDTLFLSDLGSDGDITSPVIGTGGTVSGVTYDTGHDGNAATVSNGDTLSILKSGNYNAEVGSISMWAKAADWDKTVYLLSDSDSNAYIYARQYNDVTRMRWKLTLRSTIGTYMEITAWRAYGTWASSSWHHFVFSWDTTAGVIAATVDGGTYTSFYDPWTPSGTGDSLWVGYINYNGNPAYAQDVTIDELRITDKLYKNGGNPYITTPTILESTSFDTEVASPVWGNIEWDEAIPSKTDIYIQTNISDDDSSWDGWLDRGMVSFTYDDGYASQYDYAYPILDQYGFDATAYVTTNLIFDNSSSATYMSLAELHELENAGWEIGGHGETHADLDTLDDAEKIQEFGTESHDWLETQGFNVRSMATPYGRSASGNIFSDYYDYVRGYASGHVVGSYPYPKKYNIQWGYAQDAGALDDAKGYVDTAEANKEWVVFTDHGVGENDTLLAPLAEYVDGKDVDVVTFSEGADNLTGSSALFVKMLD